MRIPIKVRAPGAYFPIFGFAARCDKFSFAVGILTVVKNVGSRTDHVTVYLLALEPNPPGTIIVVSGWAVLTNVLIAVVRVTDFSTLLGIAKFSRFDVCTKAVYYPGAIIIPPAIYFASPPFTGLAARTAMP